jgi:purine-binding chemotaxis protein CheW
VFTLDEQRYALPVRDVERIVRAVEVTPLPRAPDVVLGVVNVQGRIVPVFNLRRRFRMPEREIGLSDHLIVARASGRTVALVVDSAIGVMEWDEPDRVSAKAVTPGVEYVEGVVKRPDGMIFIHDLGTFLSSGETRQMEEALAS